MLYKEAVVPTEKIDFLFEAEPYNEDINIREIAAIQNFFEKYGYIPDQHITTFLNWVTYSARKNVTNELESVMDSSLAGRCAPAQSFLNQILEKMGFLNMTFNVGDVLGSEPIHALTCVQIPTKINGEDAHRLFMLDPTFRQFCITEENRFERYNEEPRWGVRMSTPHPGYFFNLTEEGRAFANGLIHYGYFEINEESLKSYFDPFALYVTPKADYTDQNMVGRISSTTASGQDYWQRIIQVRHKEPHHLQQFNLNTPKEIIHKEDNKLINRLRGINVQSELDAMFEEQNIGSKSNNNSKK